MDRSQMGSSEDVSWKVTSKGREARRRRSRRSQRQRPLRRLRLHARWALQRVIQWALHMALQWIFSNVIRRWDPVGYVRLVVPRRKDRSHKWYFRNSRERTCVEKYPRRNVTPPPRFSRFFMIGVSYQHETISAFFCINLTYAINIVSQSVENVYSCFMSLHAIFLH